MVPGSGGGRADGIESLVPPREGGGVSFGGSDGGGREVRGRELWEAAGEMSDSAVSIGGFSGGNGGSGASVKGWQIWPGMGGSRTACLPFPMGDRGICALGGMPILLRRSIAVEFEGPPSGTALSGRLRIWYGRGRSGNLGLLSDKLRDRERLDWVAAMGLRTDGI